MELENENEKYAFLLGSTLRNEDADRFINIYDAIIPKDIPPNQVVFNFLQVENSRLVRTCQLKISGSRSNVKFH